MNRALVNSEIAFMKILSLMPAFDKNSELRNLNNSVIRSIGKVEFGNDNDTGGKKYQILKKTLEDVNRR